jgi:hypothetical protein
MSSLLLHSIRNAKALTGAELEQVSSLSSEEKTRLIYAYNSSLKGLEEFIQELLRSLVHPATPRNSVANE